MNIKKTAILILMFLSVSYVFGAKVETIDETRYMGLELSKMNRNAFVITDDASEAPAYTDDAAWNTYVHAQPLKLLSFPSVTDNITPSVTKDFYVRYEFETPGYLYLYFTSQSDFGYNNSETPESGAPAKYENPWMLMSVGGNGLNYNITCTSNMAYFGENITEGNTVVSKWLPAGANVESSTGTKFACTQKINDLILEDAGDSAFAPNGEAAALSNAHVKSGAVFQKKINKGHVRGVDHYQLELVKPGEDAFPAGLYYGYIIAHFAVAE